MLVTQCPRCHESVSVPDRLCNPAFSSSAQAQCPWCLATLHASEIRSIVPPALVLIGDEHTVFNDQADAVVVPTQSDNDLETEESTQDEFTFVDDEPLRSEDEFQPIEIPHVGTSPAMMDVDHSRRKRKSSGGIRSILGVVLGGLLALPIVGLLLHVLGRPAPIIGDVLETYIPMGNRQVVNRASGPMPYTPTNPAPADDQPIQGRSLADEMTPLELNPGTSPAESALAELGMGAGTDSPSTGPEMLPLPDPAPAEAELPDVEEVNLTPADERVLESDAVFNADPDAQPNLSAVLPSAVMETGEPDGEPDASVAGDADTSPDTDQPETAKPSRAKEVQRLQGIIDQIDSMGGDDPERGGMVDSLFRGLADLAAQGSGEAASKVQAILGEVASDMSLIKAFALAAPDWIANTDQRRKTDGTIVVGKLFGEPGNATIILSNKQELSVVLPPGSTTVPGGIQIGMGRIQREGDQTTISLEMLQGLNL